MYVHVGLAVYDLPVERRLVSYIYTTRKQQSFIYERALNLSAPLYRSYIYSIMGTQGPASLFLYVVRYFSLYCVSFRVFTFFYESIYLGGGFKGSFFSSLSASML